MLVIEIFALFLAISAVCIGFAIFKQNEVSQLFGGFGALMLMFAGLALLTDGISYSQGLNANETMNYTYEELNSTLFNETGNFSGFESVWIIQNISKTTSQLQNYATYSNTYTQGLGIFLVATGAILLAAIASTLTRRTEDREEGD